MTKIAYFLIIASTLTAQDAPQLPEKVSTLKSSYSAAINRATAPITKAYVAELEKLRTEFTKKGDLQAALATDQELKAVTALLNPAPGKTPIKQASGAKGLLTYLQEHRWKASNGNMVITFVNDQEFTNNGSAAKQFKVRDATNFELYWTNEPSGRQNCVLSKDRKSFKEGDKMTWTLQE